MIQNRAPTAPDTKIIGHQGRLVQFSLYSTFHVHWSMAYSNMAEVLLLCNYRCILFDNFDRTETQQKELIRMIKSMTSDNGRYTNQLFENAFSYWAG